MGLPRSKDKLVDTRGVLDAWSTFHTTRYIYAPRAHRLNGRSDIAGMQATSQHHLRARGYCGGQGPVRHLPRATARPFHQAAGRQQAASYRDVAL
jgi:hypothetical protein